MEELPELITRIFMVNLGVDIRRMSEIRFQVSAQPLAVGRPV
jgi:hypothetical protein